MNKQFRDLSFGLSKILVLFIMNNKEDAFVLFFSEIKSQNVSILIWSVKRIALYDTLKKTTRQKILYS